jgi:hypothetical protein
VCQEKNLGMEDEQEKLFHFYEAFTAEKEGQDEESRKTRASWLCNLVTEAHIVHPIELQLLCSVQGSSRLLFAVSSELP